MPVLELFRRHRRAVLLGFLGVTGHNALNYTMAVYALSLMTSPEVGLDRAEVLERIEERDRPRTPAPRGRAA